MRILTPPVISVILLLWQHIFPTSVQHWSYNYKVSGGRCSKYSKCDTEMDKRIICSQSLFYDGEGLKKDENDYIIYSYVGFTNSYFVSYPYRHEAYGCDGKCTEYDPRYRPWYVSAITGAKNVLIIIDFSGSMSGKKIEKAKEATIQVINTLGQNDWFQVVLFGTEAKSVTGDNHLLQADNKNKEIVIQLIKEQILLGATNFEAAFKLAFDLYENTEELEFVSYSCQTIFLFMTDGQVTQGIKDKDELTQMINQKNAQINASIFTYSFGDDADKIITSAIACDNHGVWTQVGEENIGNTMAQYYNFLAVGVSDGEQNGVLWSEIYDDAGLGIEMITATVPIYFEDKGTKKLLGVFGADLLVSDLKQFNDFETDVYPKLASRARKQCTVNTLDGCKLEQYRSQKCFTDQQCNYDVEQETSICSFKIQASPWETNGKKLGGAQTICATKNAIKPECNNDLDDFNQLNQIFKLSVFYVLLIFNFI